MSQPLAPAKAGPLACLQFNPRGASGSALYEDALGLTSYKSPTGSQPERHQRLAQAAASFLAVIAEATPSGPERSTAISRAREAKFWASAAIALEAVNEGGI